MKKLKVINQQFLSIKDVLSIEPSIYFDNNASTQIDDGALNKMIEIYDGNCGNPSSPNNYGKNAANEIVMARKSVADFFDASPENIIFTSGGTESINLAINNHINNPILTIATEHNATLNAVKRSSNYHILQVNENGHFAIEDFHFNIRRQQPGLASIMVANNETGTLHENLEEAINIAHLNGWKVHLDAVQVAGKLNLSQYTKLGADYISISAHKFHGPKGVGALYIKDLKNFKSLLYGGSQEFGIRPGTENVAGIAALGVICQNPLYSSDELKLRLIYHLKNIPHKIHGGGLHSTINVGFKNIHRDMLVHLLNEKNISVSYGSACSNGNEPSHVLSAMNIGDEYLYSSIRISFSKYNTVEEVDRFIKVLTSSINKIKKVTF